MKILFQGDSITDCGRDRNDVTSLGGGYPKMVAKLLRATYCDTEFEFVNTAISGHKTEDLLARWQKDAVDIDPDIMVLLVGVNDTWHNVENKTFIPNEIFEQRYRELLEAMKQGTKTRIIIMEPFALDFPDTEGFFPDLDEKTRIIRRLAREYADIYIPLDGIFASACVSEPPSYWTHEGVHPTEEGHKLIADYCFNAICDIIEDM